MDHASTSHSTAPGVSRWAVEFGTAAFVAVIGAVVLNGSLEQGIGWSSTGPESGYFPFYIGLLIIVSGTISAISALRSKFRLAHSHARGEIFLEYSKLKPVLQVFLPTAIYIVSIRWLGLYIASAVFVAAFMMWHGNYRWKALWTGIGTSAFFYLVLELWFKIDLFKGPLLAWLLDR
jgi:hypothetical protein